MNSKTQQSPFEKEVARTNRRFQTALAAKEVMELKLKVGDVQGAYEASFELVDAVEKLTLVARQLPAYTGHPEAQKTIEQHIVENVPIRAGFTPEGWFGVAIPALLPSKKKGWTDYMRESLYASLKRFFRDKDRVRYPNCVIIFRHIYQRDRPERLIRDHDNIETKAVVDAVAFYVLFDDGPYACEHYYCSTTGDENKTEIYVVPQSDLEKWIHNVKNNENREMMLYENRP